MGDFTLFGLPVSLGTMIFQAAMFTVLVFLLKNLVFKKITGILEKRRQYIETQLQLAEQCKLDAEKNLAATENALKQAKIEAREIRNRSEKEARIIIQAAKEEAKQVLIEARKDAYLSHTQTFPRKEEMKGA